MVRLGLTAPSEPAASSEPASSNDCGDGETLTASSSFFLQKWTAISPARLDLGARRRAGDRSSVPWALVSGRPGAGAPRALLRSAQGGGKGRGKWNNNNGNYGGGGGNDSYLWNEIWPLKQSQEEAKKKEEKEKEKADLLSAISKNMSDQLGIPLDAVGNNALNVTKPTSSDTAAPFMGLARRLLFAGSAPQLPASSSSGLSMGSALLHALGLSATTANPGNSSEKSDHKKEGKGKSSKTPSKKRKHKRSSSSSSASASTSSSPPPKKKPRNTPRNKHNQKDTFSDAGTPG